MGVFARVWDHPDAGVINKVFWMRSYNDFLFKGTLLYKTFSSKLIWANYSVSAVFLLKELEHKCSENRDEILGKWETKCSEFWRQKVWRKSTAASYKAQINMILVPVNPRNLSLCGRVYLCIPVTTIACFLLLDNWLIISVIAVLLL